MKKWPLLIFLVFYGLSLFAQTSVVVNPVNDTVKAKWGKIKIVDGTKMISSNDILKI
jgi:hypothetical protein